MKTHLTPVGAFLNCDFSQFSPNKEGMLDPINLIDGKCDEKGQLQGPVLFYEVQRIPIEHKQTPINQTIEENTEMAPKSEKVLIPYKIANFKNGKLDGRTIHFQQENGILKMDDQKNLVEDTIYSYQEGKLSSSALFKNGELYETTQHLENNTARVSQWKNGNLLEQTDFNGSKQHGEYFRYVESDKPHIIHGNYSQGLKDGLWSERDTSGNVVSRSTWQGDKKHGPSLEYKENHIEAGYYSDGKKENTFFQFDKISEVATYGIYYEQDQERKYIKIEPLSLQTFFNEKDLNYIITEIGDVRNGQPHGTARRIENGIAKESFHNENGNRVEKEFEIKGSPVTRVLTSIENQLAI